MLRSSHRSWPTVARFAVLIFCPAKMKSVESDPLYALAKWDFRSRRGSKRRRRKLNDSAGWVFLSPRVAGREALRESIDGPRRRADVCYASLFVLLMDSN